MKNKIWSPSDIEFTDRNYRQNSKPQPTTKRLVDNDGEDFYPTPEWATAALLAYETFTGNVWECACGDGAMAQVLKEKGIDVVSTDLFDRGYGEPGVDFLKADKLVDNIVTNPPYNLAGQFVTQGLRLAQKKLALLLRLAFLEGVERHQKIFAPTPPSRVWVFSERITFYPKNAEVKGSGTTAYAWFVWDKEATEAGQIGWIRPGLKKNKAGQVRGGANRQDSQSETYLFP
ncbi:MAG TPA: hypothetical protein VEH84_08930 [Alphaproteobacteria bacterium]|nr:hypothetical protein [Alphaproteobacteria bacterium]